jgi:hypothetical protein
VRQFNDLLRVLPPIPQAITGQPVARRSGSPSRPLTPTPARSEVPPGRADVPPGRADVGRYTQARPEAGRADPVRRPPPPPSRNGRQSPHYQR